MMALPQNGVANDLFRWNSQESLSVWRLTASFQDFFIGASRWLCTGAFLICFFSLSGMAQGQTVSTPTFSPATGASYAQFNVTVTDATSGASLYYTLDGTTPTGSSHTVASGGTVTITQTETLKVIGHKSGYTNSTVASANYAVTGQIVGGLSHSVALRSDGSVWAWGLNDYGEVGDGTTTLRYSPVQVETSTTGPTYLTGVTQVSAGNYFTMALKSNGTVWCWGSNGNGNLGNGTTTGSSVPVQVVESITGFPNLTNVIAISAGAMQCFALKSDGTVWAWGKNNYGQLGDGTTTARSRAVQVTGVLSGVTVEAISAGYYHELALDNTGKVYAWGYNNDGQLGDGTTMSQSSPEHISSLDSSNIVALAGGGYHSIALESNGTVLAWGLNSDGQVGDTTMINRTSPTQVHNLGSSSGMIDIIAGGYHSLAIKSDGTVWGWGENNYGQLGVGNLQNSVVPEQMTGVSGTEVVGAGDSHTMVAKNNGTVYFCGENEYGQAGDDSGDRLSPIQANGLGTSTALSLSGGYHALTVKNDGTLWSFGANLSGELGDTTTNEHLGPEQVSSLTNILSASTGEFFSLAVDNTGKLWSWGANDQGQLGYTSSGTGTPTQVSSLSGIASASAGPMYSLALKSNGTLWAWGANYSGQLGFSSPTHTGTPTQVTGGFGSSADIVASAAGGNSSLAIDSSGNLWTWGANSYGQLGIGNTTGTSTPTEVTSLEGITKSAVLGQYHGLALNSYSQVYAWGADNSGQLGDGSITQENSPEHIFSLDPVYLNDEDVYVVALAAGNTHSIALKSDGTVWVWGLNSDGQLGDGTRNSQDAPEMVSGLNGVVAISAGINSSMALKQDGTIASWGNDTVGQLSVGPNYSVPMTIPGLNLYVGTLTPTLSITAPTNNLTFTLAQAQTGPVNFTATASETGGSIASVSYYLDSTLLYTSTTGSSFSYNWTPNTWGNFTFTAVATDTAGNTSYHSSPVTVEVPFDSDNNGLPDWWELQYGIFGLGFTSSSSPDGNGYTLLQDFQAGADPTDYYSQPNGTGGAHIIVPTVTITSGNNQTSTPGNFTAQPLVVSVTNSSGGAALPNAPVTFTVMAGGGQVAGPTAASLGTAVSVVANSSGQAQAYYQQPSTNNVTSSISAATAGQSVGFSEATTVGDGTFDAPSNVVATLVSETEMDLSWINHASTATSITIRESTDNDVTWTVIASLSDPTATSYAVTGLTPGTVYDFSVCGTK